MTTVSYGYICNGRIRSANEAFDIQRLFFMRAEQKGTKGIPHIKYLILHAECECKNASHRLETSIRLRANKRRQLCDKYGYFER